MPCTRDDPKPREEPFKVTDEHRRAEARRLTRHLFRFRNEPIPEHILNQVSGDEITNLCEAIREFGGTRYLNELLKAQKGNGTAEVLYRWWLRHKQNDAAQESGDPKFRHAVLVFEDEITRLQQTIAEQQATIESLKRG